MVQTEAYYRVLRIKCGNDVGTTFTIEHNDEQFLVTAKHLFKKANFPSRCIVELLMDRGYVSKKVKIAYHEIPSVDIAVMKLCPPENVTPTYDNPFTKTDVIIGQDVFFLGFPFHFEHSVVRMPSRGIPMPLVKKACLSALQDMNDGSKLLLLDGINNPGFSGGPVCFKPHSSKIMSICGIVKGYRYNPVPLYDDDDNEKPYIVKDENGNETFYYVRENTGIIYAYDIIHVHEILRRPKVWQV